MLLYKILTYYAYIFTTEVFACDQRNSNVTLLTSRNFYHLVNNDHIWVVHFYSSKTNGDQSLGREFTLSADILKGIVKFGSFDVDDNEELVTEFTIDRKYLPVVKFYGISSDGKPKDYDGPKLAKDLVESVLTDILEKIKTQFGEKLPENLIEEVNDSNFDKTITNSKEPWMVLFYAPWCVHCKEFKPIWTLVAASLRKKIKCASFDATIDKVKAKEYKITEYPTIKLFPFANKSPLHTFAYTGDRTVESIVDWALELLPGPDVRQIVNPEIFQRHCMEQNLCVISVLPSLFDCQAHCRNNYLDIIKKLGEEFKKEGWGWVWTEAGAQRDLESVLDIGGFGYPAMVVLNPVKMKYSVFKGAFTKSRIDEFLTKLAKAKAIGVEEDVGTKIVTAEPWDGEDSVNELPDELYLYDTEFSKKDEL